MSNRKRSRLLNALDASVAPVFPPASSSSVISSPSTRVIKREPTDAVVPVKRTSSARDDDALAGAAKRVKPESKGPLSLVNSNTSAIPAVVPPASAEDLSDVRARLEEIQHQITQQQALLGVALRKRTKSKSDLTRIARYERKLVRLRALKEKYHAAIPAAAPVIAPSPSKVEAKQVQAVASVPNLAREEVRPFSINLPFGQVQPSALGSDAVKQEVKPLSTKFPVNPLPVPSGSKDIKPLVSYGGGFPGFQAPVASSSKDVLKAPKLSDFEGSDNDLDDNFVPDMDQNPLHQDDKRFDEDGNFYGRGRDMFVGPQAKADDIDRFLLAAGNAEQFNGNERVEDALVKLGLPALYRPLPGMEIALMPHQVIGVAWMLDKENSPYKGGCMSDEMGLGKTVQMISVIVSNQSEDPMCKTNLIVAPLALLDQWQLEIEMKTNCDLKCLIYHGSNKPKKRKDLLKYDVVLTTFHTLALEWPDAEAEEKKAKKKAKQKKKDDFIESDSEDERKPKKKKNNNTGLLMQVEWYRVTLDESQNIRNRRTRISRAVTKLNAKYRWCLTGTPIINGLSDAYGLVRFLRIRPWYDWDEFNSHITKLEKKQPTLATKRLQAIFASMLLRRKKDTMLDGKRLIELPSKEVNLVKLEFSLEERDIYKMVELQSQAIFNRFLRAGTVLKNYHQVLVLLLRLRQCCSHPSLIQEKDDAAFITAAEFNDKHYNRRYELSRAAQLVSPQFVEKMKAKFKQTVLQRMEAEKQSADATIEGEECPICFDTFSDPVVTPCSHVFCKDCILEVFNGAAVEDGGDDQLKYQTDERPCPACRGVVSKHKLFSRRAFEPTDAELDPNSMHADDEDGASEEDDVIDLTDDEPARPPPGRTLRTRKPQKRWIVDSEDEEDEEEEDEEEEDEEEEDDDDMSDFIMEDDEDEEEKDARRVLKKRLGKRRAIVLSEDEMENADIICGAKRDVDVPPEQVKMMPRFLPSTKMKHMMESLRTWAEEHPDEKTLIISQWTQCLQLVSDYLAENDFLHVKYQGDMNRQKRDQAVRVFMSKDKATVMLMSLKCGGVGLNLTRANRVISLDLGWSEAIESQAFDRVHRLGQTRTVHVHRLVISDTVEDRVLALQERKKNLADGSLGEGSGKKIGRLSVRELANLFGLDQRGQVLDD
ncbi:hypothetical protein SCP_1102340 [Sparassis crispa]|uniref:ATP-dependent helicase n=1 Tax=Sparassis crispa TaxID=139825 RepID=A0A401GZF5_9APHY|nr:hypothetical protein SCP_1102340 [Sparassis crispa]GBE87557.1 hypothetical protein SCP_1102340 [Sparassis crispa]